MSGNDAHFAVMFADVAGSTRLYETLGDKDAKALIDDLVERMSSLTRRHGGSAQHGPPHGGHVVERRDPHGSAGSQGG